MTVAPLTSDNLFDALQAVVDASSDQQCASAVVSAAQLIQDAILNDQEVFNASSVIEEAVEAYPNIMRIVVDRAVDFHPIEDGDFLGLWLIPIVIEHSMALPATLRLTTNGLDSIRASSSVLKQMGLTAEALSGEAKSDRKGMPVVGWAYALNSICSDNALRNLDLGALVRIPHETRRAVRGSKKTVDLRIEADNQPPGVSTYYLPVIVKHPKGKGMELPASSDQMVHAVHKWVSESLPILGDGNSVSINVHGRPHPFTTAMAVGQRAELDARFRRFIHHMVEQTKISPSAMSALIAPYDVVNSPESNRIGVSFVSRLTGAPIALMNVPVNSDDSLYELAMLTQTLRELGVEDVVEHTQPTRTFSCQTCSAVQLRMPTPKPFENVPASTLVH